MSKEKYIEDLKQIKDMMDRSSRFISLSGWSGIFAGIFALTGAYLAYQHVYSADLGIALFNSAISEENQLKLLGIATATLLLSIAAVIYFTTRQAKKDNQKIWDQQAKRLLISLAIPLVTGGILCLFLLLKGHLGIILPLTLIFYGLALVNASKYTLSEIRNLGLIEIVLGLIAFQFMDFSLILWAIGFGLIHIVYGLIMYLRKSP